MHIQLMPECCRGVGGKVHLSIGNLQDDFALDVAIPF